MRAELERILASPHFEASEKRRVFLRFIVEETLAGRADRLKGYTIALAVFGRDETFDSQADPVVRLEARRLRRDLDGYYVSAGSSDPVRISIPKGSYVPSFEWPSVRSPAAATEQETTTGGSRMGGADARHGRATGRQRLAIGVAAVIVSAAVAGWFLLAGQGQPIASTGAREPAVVVMPFEPLSATDTAQHFAQGIGQELSSSLFRFSGFRLYTLPVSVEKTLKGGAAEIGRNLGVTYVVSGSVRTDRDEISVATQVSNAETGQIVWTRTYTRPSDPQALIRVQRELAAEIATVLGQPYGVVKTDMDVRRKTPAVSNMQSYVCVLRAYSFRRSFPREEFEPVLHCLEEAVRHDPAYSDAWAMLGWLHVDAGRLGYSGEANRQDEYDKALAATSRAATLQPNNPLALKALAAAYHYLGRYDDSERTAREAAALNPNDPEVMAQLGWRLAVRGKFDEGIPLLKRAIERTVNPPAWYFHLIAVDLYLNGDYQQMLNVAERSALGDYGFSYLLLAIANAQLGHEQAAQQALKIMAQFEPLARDPAGYMRRHGATDEIVDALMSGLQKAQQVALRQ